MRKTVFTLLLALMLLICLTGCSRYSSHYSALMIVHSNTSSSSYMSFSSFNGTKTFKMNCKNASGGLLEYSAKLETGSATVYYDHDGNKTELFTIRGGEEIKGTAVPVTAGPVYVIVETNEKCKEGKFDFNLKQ
ncbi:MAG: hypothetical protein IJJ95_05945 [Spirochaetales bacterium]|nr:hypothetical protein [Spirochaetales bacterium]